MDPEVNGVTMGRGTEGGPGSPSGEQDKQLICNSGVDKTSMGEPGGQPDGLEATSRTPHAQSMLHCETVVLASLYIVNVNIINISP
jgi:hypothetical protein